MLDLLLVLVFICSFLSFFLFVNSRAGMSYSNLFVAHLRGRSPEAPSGAFATLSNRSSEEPGSHPILVVLCSYAILKCLQCVFSFFVSPLLRYFLCLKVASGGRARVTPLPRRR